MREAMTSDILETCLLQHRLRRLPSPHRSEALATLADGNGRAMKQRDCVKERAQREVEVLLKLRRTANVLQKIYAAIS